MDYETFKQEMTEDLKQRLYERGIEDVEMGFHNVEKANQHYESLTVRQEGSNVGVNFNIESAFAEYEHTGDYAGVLAESTHAIMQGLENVPSVDESELTNYEVMKEKLSIEVISAETNAELLTKVPHESMEDMAVVYRFVLESNDAGRASILVTNDMIDHMGVTHEQLKADALENAPEIRPAVIQGMSEVMREMMGPEAFEMFGLPEEQEEMMYVATVPDKNSGAGVLAYQDFMDQAAEKLGGEVCGLRWEDLDFDDGIINVEHTLVYYNHRDEKGCYFNVHKTKTRAGTRTIPMLDEVRDAFLVEKEYQEFNHLKCNVTIDGYTDFVFINRFGNVQHQGTLNKAIRRIIRDCNDYQIEKAGKNPVLLPKFSCHSLRHTFTTRLVEAGVNIKVVQNVLGHADFSTTMDIYTDVTKELKKREFDDLGEKMKKQKRNKNGETDEE